jgi:UDP-N-acetylmuramyl pentapeptide synthase
MGKQIEDIKNIVFKIRESLSYNTPFELSAKQTLDYNPKISQVYITLFQEGQHPIRWGSRKQTLEESIQRIIFKLKTNPSFYNFLISDKSKCRILFEMVTKEYPCNIRNLTTMRMKSPNRFESGINGLKYKYNDITRYFMPTDGYTKSIMSVNQLLNYLSKQCGVAKKTNKISERVHLMRREAIEYTFIESIAYITYNDEVLKLERGYPLPIEFNKDIVYDKTMKSVDWLVKNMNQDGSFLYFYDPYNNTIVDDMHPTMTNPLYNNILRHSGGTVSLIRGYELSGNKLYLQKAKESIDFFISTFQEHTYKDKYACYPFFNKKSKLGGAGIGLVAMMHYYIHTKDENYRKYLDGLVRHILSRVDETGELIGYYIHPKFNDGKPLINPSDEIKKELFSFYYPGEALLGLALYYLHIKNIDEDLKKDIREKSEQALDFLVDIRPIKYDYMFDALPADAWLMQAIEEWVKVDGLKKQSYIDFVFNDTKQMFEHMYRDDNTYETNKDYIGGFYYEYGEHVYHDASRCEGVVSAYYLAKYLKDEQKASWIMQNMMLSAKGLMKTFHDEKSNYCHINPKKALHSFRFKLTRQWVRVDSVQHAACFFARLLPVFDETFKENNTNVPIGKKQMNVDIKSLENSSQSGIKYLKKFDISQFWRFFVDGRFQKKYNGWVGYEGGERGSVPALINGFAFMLENFDISTGLKATYLRELHKICMLSVETTNLKSSPGDIRYLNSGMPFFSKTTTYEHLVEVFDLRRGDGTAIFNSEKWGKPADELDVDEIYQVMKKDGKINYRNWYPNLDKKQQDAIEGKLTLHEFYEAKHAVQMMMVSKMEEIVQRYNTNIKKAKTQDEKLEVICLVSREMELLHPFPDGNCRTFSCVTLTHLLMYNGFPPALLENPNLDNEVSFSQWIEEVKVGMQRTLNLIQNPELSLFSYSILDMEEENREKFVQMAKPIQEILDNHKEIFLTPKKLEEYTKGTWITDINYNMRFTGVGTYGTYYKGNIYFTMAIKDWIKDGKNPIKELEKVLSKDIKAVVIDDISYLKYVEHLPVFLVDDCFEAFKKCSIEVRQDANPYTVLITGTEGKTGAKVQLHHLLNKQNKAHGVLNSANTEVPVLRSLINLEPDDNIEINEVSVGSDEAYRVERTMMVNPDLCFFTNIAPNHMDMHKTMENILIAKSSVVEGLKDDGVCIVNDANEYCEGLIEQILKRKPNTKIIKYGTSIDNEAYLIDQTFNNEKIGWDVKANISGREINYFVPMLQKHSALASVGILLVVSFMGYSVEQAARDFATLEPFETMGRVLKIKKKSGTVLFYDQSRRGGIGGMTSAFDDLKNIKVKGRVIALVGGISIKKDSQWTKESHKELAKLINDSAIDRLYTTGNFMNYVHEELKKPEILIKHEDDIDTLATILYNDIKGGDLLFIIGSAYLYLGRVSDRILKKKDKSKYDINIENYDLSTEDINTYKALVVMDEVENSVRSNIALFNNNLATKEYKKILEKYSDFTNFRAEILMNFFKSIDTYMQNEGLKVVNKNLDDSFKSFIYNKEFCIKWFNNLDKKADLPKKQLFGSFYDFGHKKYLLHIEVATMNLHIGFVQYKKVDGVYSAKRIEDDKTKNDILAFIKTLNINLDFEVRKWGLRWCTVDCGKGIDLTVAENFITMNNLEKSIFFKDILTAVVKKLV